MTSLRHPKVTQANGSAANVQLLCLRGAALLSRFFQARGMQRFTWLVAPLFDNRNSAVLELPAGGKIQIYLKDGYWTRLLVSGFVYEPEIGFILNRLLTQPDTYFLDCGANIGYWSVIASTILSPGRTLAFEASPPQFDELRQNAELNEDRFEAILGAIWSRTGEPLVIMTHDRRHAGDSVVNRREKAGQPGYRACRIESITIDSVCEKYVSSPDARIVIKLDVEDAEIPALVGARGVLRTREVVVLYEDHGKDSSCRISVHFINNLEFDVFYCDATNTLRRMNSVADVRNIKSDASKGYNFCACGRGSIFSKLLAGSCT
jgi:FkbM family methyltransferase